MTPAEHLGEARRALADGYKRDADPTNTMWGRVNDAKRHLEAIAEQDSEYASVKQLMHEVLMRERKIKTLCSSIANNLMIRQREIFTDELEQYCLNRGMFVNIELSGPDKTSMRFLCPSLLETSIDRIFNETNFFSYLSQAGFRKVMLGDNEEHTRTYRIEQL
jgi:hypothetical protein